MSRIAREITESTPRPKAGQFILAIIALALALASCASASAAGNQQQEDARPLLIYPKTFVCVFPGVTHTIVPEQRQPIPPGKQFKDLCPPGGQVYLFLDTGSPPFMPRTVSDLPPPGTNATGPHASQPDTGPKTP